MGDSRLIERVADKVQKRPSLFKVRQHKKARLECPTGYHGPWKMLPFAPEKFFRPIFSRLFPNYETALPVPVMCENFPGKFRVFVYEDRTRWPTAECPLRPPMPGDKYADYVPVCYV